MLSHRGGSCIRSVGGVYRILVTLRDIGGIQNIWMRVAPSTPASLSTFEPLPPKRLFFLRVGRSARHLEAVAEGREPVRTSGKGATGTYPRPLVGVLQ
jgi:hypothetical protein